MLHHTPSTQTELVPSKAGQQVMAFLSQLLALGEEPAESGTRQGRGRPATFSLQQIWLGLLIGILQQADGLRQVWRLLATNELGRFPLLSVTYEAVRSRLLSAGTAPLQALFEQISLHLQERAAARGTSALPLAPFASQIVALDETTLDQLKRLTGDLREVPARDPHLNPGKVAGLFDLRSQQWVRLQFHADVLAYCNTGILLLLEGLERGALIMADLGYFSFPWFDYLTEQGYYRQVFYEDQAKGVLDALVDLGAYRADRCANVVRLVQFPVEGVMHTYLSNVLDPAQLSLLEIAQVYARRWFVELLFKRIKQLLRLHTLRCKTLLTAKATITALLLGWALLEEESTQVRQAMRDAMECTRQKRLDPAVLSDVWWQEDLAGPLSEWKLAAACFDLLCQQIRGSYTRERFQACLPRLQRFLGSGHRKKRPHLYTEICRWLGIPETDTEPEKEVAMMI